MKFKVNDRVRILPALLGEVELPFLGVGRVVAIEPEGYRGVLRVRVKPEKIYSTWWAEEKLELVEEK